MKTNFRSFVYAEPACKDGEIPIDKLISYVKEYLKYHNLKKIDIEKMLTANMTSLCNHFCVTF